ncbi:MAG: J domain-containing protein [Alphaproteobacteria bacterium]|nr:J domain-containing protein [Alphaproteobacteria bacterium]
MPAATFDPYDVLGVERTARRDFIRWQFRTRAKACHPDTNPDNPAAAEEFRRLCAAYTILNDKERRREYDRGRYEPTGQEWTSTSDPTLDIGEDAARWERYFEGDVQWQVEAHQVHRASTRFGRFAGEIGVFFSDIFLMLLTILAVGALTSLMLWGVVELTDYLGFPILGGS